LAISSSRSRPKIPKDIRKLMLEMSVNPLRGAPQIHGELLSSGSILVRPRLQSTSSREGLIARQERIAIKST
jgi:hypothetical protein